MRILIITENFLPKVDGVTRTLSRLLEHLQAKGHTVLLFGPESNMETYAGADLVGTTGIPIVLYPELKMNMWRPEFTRRLLGFQPHVIHLVDPIWLGAAALAVCQWHRLRIPIVASYHTNIATYCSHFGVGILSSLVWRWIRFCHTKCQYTVCPSPSTARMLQAHGFDQPRIWPRGVDTTLYSPTHRSAALRARWLQVPVEQANEKAVLLYVGRVSYEKNLDLLVQAYKNMHHEHCHLVMVGHGPALDTIQDQCDRQGIPVTFTGYLQGQALAAAFASADVFAFPSRTETFGQVVLEAMASGLPVVGLDADGVCDLVENGQTGRLLDTTDQLLKDQHHGYRALLNSLVDEPEKRQQMSAQAVRTAKKYSWWEAMEAMVGVYQDAVEHSNLLYSLSDQAKPAEDSGCLVLDVEEHSLLPEESRTTTGSL